MNNVSRVFSGRTHYLTLVGKIPRGESLFYRKVWRGDTVFNEELEQLKTAILCCNYPL